MRIEGRLEGLWKWSRKPAPADAADWQYAQWRANHDEARAIARYFRWLAERSGGTDACRFHGQR